MIEFTTGMMVFLGAMYGSPASQTDAAVPVQATSTPAAVVENYDPATLEEYLKEYFVDEPILVQVAKCESTFRQFGKDGKPIRGIANAKDVGVMQINEDYHLEDAKKAGFDIYTLEGNIGYAKFLYSKYGSKPWVHSSPCWKKYEAEHIAVK
jgi:hypothetical protein